MKKHDISSELYRQVVTRSGTYRIDSPQSLFIREGGKTHRVQDSTGLVHCYVAPESGESILQWMPRDTSNPVAF